MAKAKKPLKKATARKAVPRPRKKAVKSRTPPRKKIQARAAARKPVVQKISPKPSLLQELASLQAITPPPPVTALLPAPEQKMAPKPAEQKPAKEEPIKPIMSKPQTQEPEPAQIQKPSAPGTIIEPSLAFMPPWQDKERLSSFIADEGVKLTAGQPGSEASAFLSMSGRKVDEGLPGYFIVQAADGGGMIGAIDGYAIQDLVVLMRARVSGKSRRELHSLLFCAAMTLAGKPKAALYLCPRVPFSEEIAGKLLFLGRREGMQAVPTNHLETLFFIRRFGKEYDLVADGKEISSLLRKAVAIVKFDGVIDEIEKKETIALIQLPMSPDSRNRLRELQDAVAALGLEAPNLASVIDKLMETYVYDRKDVTPESF